MVGREGVAPLITALEEWAAPGGHVTGLHAGDVGWHLRLPDEVLRRRPGDGIVGWWREGQVVAVALMEGDVARPEVAPDCVDDLAVCQAVADAVEEIPDAEVWTDAQPGSLVRTLLAAHGWRLDADRWLALHLAIAPPVDELAPAVLREAAAVPGVTATLTEADVEARVAVQRAAFAHSTFTLDAWHRMAAGPGFRQDLDLLARDGDGTPVAAATGWLAGPGRCGLLEPVGTRREHRHHGYGRRIVLAAIHALATAGASGVGVCTPGRNDAAVAMYESCGLRPVETVQAMVRTR